MGLMGRVLGAGEAVRGVGDAVGGVAEVFVGNRAERDAAQTQQYLAALAQYGAEFAQPRQGRFDRFMDGLNRLPRPLLVVGTLGLFVYAMIAPMGFALRMEGLALVPEPLWWLLGAIVSFYFGSRELYYQRVRSSLPAPRAAPPVSLAQPAPAGPEDPEGPEPGAPAPGDAPAPAPAGEDAPGDGPAPRPRPRQIEPRIRPAERIAETADPAVAQTRPEVQVRAADPQFNAAVEEWRRTRG